MSRRVTATQRKQMEEQQRWYAEKSGEPMPIQTHVISTDPDWNGKCEVCGASPTISETGMCGPCTFGDADTDGGNW